MRKNEGKQRIEEVIVVVHEVANISKAEVMRTLKRMKDGKTVGPDVEVWKCLGDVAVEFSMRTFNKILESEIIPEEWRRSVPMSWKKAAMTVENKEK